MNVRSSPFDLPAAALAAAREMNSLGARGEPFFFLFDFEMNSPIVVRLADAAERGIWYDFNGQTNHAVTSATKTPLLSVDGKNSVARAELYRVAFEKIHYHLGRGDIYLVNLTGSVPIKSAHTLAELFEMSSAPYKLYLDERCTVFSPESFVTVKGDRISTFPMKGTRGPLHRSDESDLLTDPKENAEHATVVDLLRNDLSMVATQVSVERYKFLQQIRTMEGDIVQMSSEVTGVLPSTWRASIGDIVCALLPAGSVSGAPKREALRIIRAVEGRDRGYYTGVAGIFDGANLDSAVLIRYVEQIGPDLFFRSGGGITTRSECEKEYQELLLKVAVPVASSAPVVTASCASECDVI